MLQRLSSYTHSNSVILKTHEPSTVYDNFNQSFLFPMQKMKTQSQTKIKINLVFKLHRLYYRLSFISLHFEAT